MIAATLVNQIGNMAFVFLVVYATQHLHLTLMQGSSAFAIFSLSTLLTSIFVGNVIDRFGAGRMMIGSVWLNGVVLLSIPFIYHFHALLFMCFLWGIFYGVFRPASQTFVSLLATEGMYKLIFSIYRLSINLGMSIGPLIGGFLAVHSYRAIFFVNGVANMLAGMILLLGLLGSASLTHESPHEHKKILSLKWVKQDAVLRLFLIAVVPISMVFFQHESTLPVYLKQDLNLPLSFYGLLFTINTLLIVFFELLLNIAILHWTYRTNFMLGSLLITVAFAAICFATTRLEIIIIALTWTLGEMIFYPSASSYIAEIAPAHQRGSYMSLFYMSNNFALFLGPWTGAVVMQQWGGATLWLVCGVCGLVSVAIFHFLAEPGRRDNA